MSACVNARRVCVRTFPRAPLLKPSAVMDISSGASTTATMSYSPSVQNTSFTSLRTFSPCLGKSNVTADFPNAAPNLRGLTLRKGFEPEPSSPLAALPQVCSVAPPWECRGLLNGSWVPRTAWLAGAAACLPTREQSLQLCCCLNKRRAAQRKSIMQQCAS
jgi:hypothetical protein